MLWSSLSWWVGASYRVNLIAPFPLGQNCPRKRYSMSKHTNSTKTTHKNYSALKYCRGSLETRINTYDVIGMFMDHYYGSERGCAFWREKCMFDQVTAILLVRCAIRPTTGHSSSNFSLFASFQRTNPLVSVMITLKEDQYP